MDRNVEADQRIYKGDLDVRWDDWEHRSHTNASGAALRREITAAVSTSPASTQIQSVNKRPTPPSPQPQQQQQRRSNSSSSVAEEEGDMVARGSAADAAITVIFTPHIMCDVRKSEINYILFHAP